jgi:hypothetical protein
LSSLLLTPFLCCDLKPLLVLLRARDYDCQITVLIAEATGIIRRKRIKEWLRFKEAKAIWLDVDSRSTIFQDD